MIKLNRNYILELQGGDGNLWTLDSKISPMTLKFSVTTEFLAETNNGTIIIYNLAEKTRRNIYHDIADYDHPKKIRLQAGYGDNLSVILFGNISQAFSYRDEGSSDFITEIHTFDWSTPFTNATSSTVLSPSSHSDGTYVAQKDVINSLVTDLGAAGPTPGVVAGAISNSFTTKYPQAQTTWGNTWKYLQKETNNNCFICNGLVHCILDNEYIKQPGNASMFVVSADTGLLSTPKKSGQLLSFEMLFEPTLTMGQPIQLVSQSESMYNTRLPNATSGAPFYKIQKISHTGVISGAVGGKCKTTVWVNAGVFTLNPQNGKFDNVLTPVISDYTSNPGAA